MEFLIRRNDRGDWNSPAALDPRVCHPTSREWARLPGQESQPNFVVAGTEFEFIDEMPGFQVIVTGGSLDRSQVTKLLGEVIERMGEATGTPGYLIDIDSYGGAPVALAGPDEEGDPEQRADAESSEAPHAQSRKPWWRFW